MSNNIKARLDRLYVSLLATFMLVLTLYSFGVKETVASFICGFVYCAIILKYKIK